MFILSQLLKILQELHTPLNTKHPPTSKSFISNQIIESGSDMNEDSEDCDQRFLNNGDDYFGSPQADHNTFYLSEHESELEGVMKVLSLQDVWYPPNCTSFRNVSRLKKIIWC